MVFGPVDVAIFFGCNPVDVGFSSRVLFFYVKMSDLFQMHVPTFGGQRSSSLNYEEKVSIWKNISPLVPGEIFLSFIDVHGRRCAQSLLNNRQGRCRQS